MKLSRAALAVSALPAAAMLLVFYSLALHMHRALGGWPSTIGERGFPPGLLVHARLNEYLCIALICSVVFVLPLVMLLSAVVQRWRRFLPYLASCALFCFIAAGLMQLAPAPFLHWWWD